MTQTDDVYVNEHRHGQRTNIAEDTAAAGSVAETIIRPRRRAARRTTGFVGALGLVGLVLAGCGLDPNDVLAGRLPHGASPSGGSAERSDVLAGLAPHGAEPSGGSAVNGVLDEWRVRADLDIVHSGPVTFTFSNTGTIIHEMLVTRTDILSGEIPIDPATTKFNEDDAASKVVGEISEFGAGQTGSVTIDLAPGNYQLVCNVPGHYTKGMSMRFTVTP